MPQGDNTSILRHFVEEFNHGELHAVDKHLSADFFASPPAEGDPPANETLHQLAIDLKAALPDLTIELIDLRSEGELVSGKLAFSGTHEHELWGSPGRGASFSWEVDATFRFDGDRFAFRLDNLAFPDMVGTLRMLGLVNPPDQMDQPNPFPVTIPDFLLRVLFTGSAGDKPCSHLDDVAIKVPSTNVCDQCVELGDVWPALRMCLFCGFVGCCDTSKNKHMKAHYEHTGHPLFRSIRMTEGWIWCFEDAAFFSSRILDRL